jgi:hypothetical protein
MVYFCCRFNEKSQREPEIAREHLIYKYWIRFHRNINWIFQLPLEPSQELEFDLNISLKFISLARDLASTIASQVFRHSVSSRAPSMVLGR